MTDQLQRTIGRIEAKLDAMSERIADHMGQSEKRLDGHSERLNSHSKRIRTVEHLQHWYAGAVAVVVFAASWFKDRF